MKLKEFYDNYRRKEWYDHASMDDAKAVHRDTVIKLEAAELWRKQEDRPVSIAVFHGSGRHPTRSCAHEASNSQLFLERSLELAQEEYGKELAIDTFVLRELSLEACNGCYSTASALCNFPCSCFPGDDITRLIYPAVVKADILLWSTPVNQSMVSTRIKTVLDRLISVDGGYFTPELPMKDDSFRERMIQLSQEEPVYDARMFGKIAGYFVTSKDASNPHPETAPYMAPFDKLTYPDLVVGAIAHQGTEFGWYHADPYYAISVSDPDVELSFDKDIHDRDTKAHEKGKEVVLASIKMAEQFIDSPPKMNSPGRYNRT